MSDNTLFYEQYREPCKRFECDPQTHQDIEYFYLDTKGYFTIGRGHCVSKAKEPSDDELRILLPFPPFLIGSLYNAANMLWYMAASKKLRLA